MASKQEESFKSKTRVEVDMHSPREQFFKRTSLFCSRSSSIKSDSSLSKFYIKQSKDSLKDPDTICKIIVKPINLKGLNLVDSGSYETPIKKVPRNSNQDRINKVKKNQQQDKYKDLTIKQVKIIEQLSEQIRIYRQSYEQLQRKFQKLEKQKQILQINYTKLLGQSNTSTNHSIEANQLSSNCIGKLKINQPLKGLGPIFQGSLEQQHNNTLTIVNQKCQNLQREFLQAMKTIKMMKTQMDCIKIKYHQDLEKQKKKKNAQYLQLKNKFNTVLSEYTEIIKTVKKLQISNKVKNAFIKKQEKQINSQLSIWSISSED